jgi:hypothetical protein
MMEDFGNTKAEIRGNGDHLCVLVHGYDFLFWGGGEEEEEEAGATRSSKV